MSKINLKDLFKNLQDELLAKLKIGESISHPTTKGDHTEVNWLEALKSLPSRYVVNNGQIIDSEGNLSEQIDVIVYDRYYSPLILRSDAALYVPAESVYAVLEIRQSLSKENIEYAGQKAKSVRQLKRTSAPVRQINGSLTKRDLPPILAGILTMDSDWNPPLGDSFIKVLNTLDLESRLNLGISLKNGSFDCSYLKGSKLTIKTSEADVALVSFFINLTKQLQLLGNAPGIDLDAYYK